MCLVSCWAFPVAAKAPDPIVLPLTGAAGAIMGGLAGSALALGVALAAQRATGDEITNEARTLNQLTTFGTLVAPALLSVVGSVAGAGISTGLVGAMTVGFGATLGAAIGTGVALALVPVGLEATADLPGGALGATAGIGGIVVATAVIGAAAAGVVAAFTLEDVNFDEDPDDVGGDDDPFAAAFLPPPSLAAAH